jgi:RNase H-fold protein (predicted Holliday junction resolvase)
MPTAPLLGSSLDVSPQELDMALDEHVLERRLTKLRLAGPELSHSRKNNLEAVKRLTDTDPYSTFGIKMVIDYVHSSDLEEDEALKMVAGITKCSRDINYTEGRGYISPSSTIKGLKATATALRRVASEGGIVTFATGHPGSMLDYYTDLADLVRKLGGRVLELAKGQIVFQGEDRDHVQVADSINGVAVLSDTCAALHTHDSRPMELMLNDALHLPDLVVADHGFAGEAINRGIPTVAVMDTNDPGLAVAKKLGANLVLVPMNDNRPNVVTREAAELVRRMALDSTHHR